jgi:hypothetical protein
VGQSHLLCGGKDRTGLLCGYACVSLFLRLYLCHFMYLYLYLPIPSTYAELTSPVVDIYDVGQQNWLPPTTLSQARYRLAAASANGMVLFAGGYGGTYSSGTNHNGALSHCDHTDRTRKWLMCTMPSSVPGSRPRL